MGKKTKLAERTPEFPSRPAAAGAEVTVVVHDEERTLKAMKGKGGWAITPTDADEARALAQFSDEALDPPPAPDAPTEPEADEDEADDSTGPAEEGPTFAAANAEADDGQEES